MKTFKTSDGIEYVINAQTGMIRQLYPVQYPYNESYVKTYDTPDYRRKSAALMHIRIGYIQAITDGPIGTLLDVGYGNGAFMRAALASGIGHVVGYDISGVAVPKGCHKDDKLHGIDEYDCVTFWDALEHFPDLSFLSDLRAKMLVVSLPWCHFNTVHPENGSIEWFNNWKHRKPNEHINHFNAESLVKTMAMHGWNIKWNADNPEDFVRRNELHRPNILTAAFARV